MSDAEGFLAEVLPRLHADAEALHNGDLGPRKALWSHGDSVTLFGALMTKRGWGEIEPAFDWLASRFHGSISLDVEVLTSGVSGDLGYVVAIEHSVAHIEGDAEPVAYELRVTTVLRREDGVWKVVHRHGDRLDRGSVASGLSSPPANTESELDARES